MVLVNPAPYRSLFLMQHIPELLDRFSFSYERDDTCLSYALFEKGKNNPISRSLVISHEIFSKSLYVSRFYPELYRQLSCKYLSAACFYLTAHHAAMIFSLSDNCSVNLETENSIFETFYSRLADFDFKIFYNRPAGRVSLRGKYHRLPFETDMIARHVS